MIRVARDILRVLRMPCREHAALISRQLDAPLARGEAIGLRIHVVYCTGCRRFRAHLRHLRSLGRTLVERADGLPPDARRRISDRLDDALKNS